ncbi:serine/threonine-protein kinase NIM1-like isoform X2 [Planococcus citri]
MSPSQFSAKEQKWCQQSTIYKRSKSLYRLQTQIGHGSYSIVHVGFHELTKEKVAIKTCNKQTLTPRAKKMLLREIAIMETVFHPNIVRLYEVLETPTKLHLVMEYMSGGGLHTRLLSEGKMKESDAKIIFAQLLSAVKHLHERNIIHRDIKAENVFCGEKNHVKLGDFGFSTVLVKGSNEELFTLCGSLPYAAPELLQERRYQGQPVDIWALGVLLYFITTGQMPFSAISVAHLKRSILLGVIPMPAHLSHSCITLIRGMLRSTPSKRFTLPEVRNSLWMSDIMISENTYDRWCIIPTLDRDEKLAEIEIKARKQLLAYGIDDKMLEEHALKGIKSDVIATYRIIIHKLLTSNHIPAVTRITAKKLNHARSHLCVIT